METVGIKHQKIKMETNTEKKIVFDTKMIISSFMAGSGVILWIISTVFSPINSVKTDIALIQKDISVINSNHEQHIQDLSQDIKEIKEKEQELEKVIAITNQVLIDHLNLKK